MWIWSARHWLPLLNFAGKDSTVFYTADNLDQKQWDKRSLGNAENIEVKKNIVDIAMQLSLQLASE